MPHPLDCPPHVCVCPLVTLQSPEADVRAWCRFDLGPASPSSWKHWRNPGGSKAIQRALFYSSLSPVCQGQGSWVSEGLLDEEVAAEWL